MRVAILRYASMHSTPWQELDRLLEDPAVLTDSNRVTQVQRERGGLTKVALKIRDFNQLEDDIAAAREMADAETDPESKSYYSSEIEKLTAQKEPLQKELEDIVAKLERAEGPLEDQLKSFEKGVGLSRHCLTHLDEVEKRVEVLTGSKDGRFTTEPFALEIE